MMREMVAHWGRFGGSIALEAITPLCNDAEHATALTEMRWLWGAKPGTAAGDRLDVLMVLVSDYEDKQHAIDPPDQTIANPVSPR